MKRHESTVVRPLPDAPPPAMSVRDLSAGFGDKEILRDIDLDLPQNRVTAIIGPSGCGKSTFIRNLNRLHEGVRSAWVKGTILLDGVDVNAPDVDPVLLRRRVGMVFQKPNPFPTMSIRDNVLAGIRLTRTSKTRDELDHIVESSLRRAALWGEVSDRLDAMGGDLSGGQQQRLCIARSIAMEPEVLLMDEPCSALDPIATARVEELIAELKQSLTIAIVTHSMQQARRVSDQVAFFLLGDLIEVAPTAAFFDEPQDARTADYVQGRFG